MDHDDRFDDMFNKETKIATVAFTIGIFVARAFYKHRMIPVKVVNASLKEMFKAGKIQTEDGADVMLQFFHK